MPLVAGAQSLADFEKRVTEFTLDNGLHFIVLERHEAPVVSFHSYVNAGSVDDPGGRTGIAHMFEHMAFKGTETIGSKNYAEEKKALAAVDEVYDALDAERARGPRADPKRIQDLEKRLEAAIAKAGSFVDANAFPRIIEENGGVGLNAGTGMDSTNYYYNFPSNRLELWFLLESERFLKPVFREFYKERDVVREERRMRVESDPQGKLMEALLATAFAAHPYRNMPGGWASDIESFRRPDQSYADDAVFDLLGGIPSSGRTGILYREMVRDRKISFAARVCFEILDRLKRDKPDAATLQRVKNVRERGSLRQLRTQHMHL